MGGSGSIGTAIVDRLLYDGYEVIIQYNQANVDTLQSQYKSQPVQFIQIDLMQDIDFADYFDFITNLDCLIYASGTALYGQIQDMTDEMIDLAYQI